VFLRWVGSLIALAALFAFSGCGGGSSDGEHTKNSDLEGNCEICHYTRFDYRFDGGGVSSKGTLIRISDERLSHVFREAGVTPP